MWKKSKNQTFGLVFCNTMNQEFDNFTMSNMTPVINAKSYNDFSLDLKLGMEG